MKNQIKWDILYDETLINGYVESEYGSRKTIFSLSHRGGLALNYSAFQDGVVNIDGCQTINDAIGLLTDYYNANWMDIDGVQDED